MFEKNTDVRRIWFIVLLIMFFQSIIGVILASVIIPGLSTEQRLDYGIKALTTTGTIFAGIAVFINAFYTGKNSEALNKSAMAALKNAEAALKNAVIAEDKQITERFAKAIEQLGSEKIEMRSGAIYTLERIAKDSAKDHWTIMEVLTAFVRENAPRKPDEENTQQTPKICTDIQAAVTVIGRRNYENDKKNQSLDLSNIDIQGANLIGANLQGAFLGGANLQGAFLIGANLQEAILYKANLQEAILYKANLQEAMLREANLQKVNIIGSHLQGAILYTANRQEAILKEAKLQDAVILGVDTLRRVLLGVANLQEVLLGVANLQEAFLSGANGANLQKADLSGAYLEGADLKGVKNLEQKQIDSARGDRTTILPDHLEYPKHWQ
ncbi:pentapeptide repeat-containing protein [Nostoc sp. C110]|uniref:pentapeptide repeat-containing protein n=1 Tax=Nostoc sp. C110 TaxID=3349876 RepID=UPI00370D897C